MVMIYCGVVDVVCVVGFSVGCVQCFMYCVQNDRMLIYIKVIVVVLNCDVLFGFVWMMLQCMWELFVLVFDVDKGVIVVFVVQFVDCGIKFCGVV